MPIKDNYDVKNPVVTEPIRYVKRTIGVSNLSDGTITVDKLHETLAKHIADGYSLFQTHFVGQNRDSQNSSSGDQFVFIFVKNA